MDFDLNQLIDRLKAVSERAADLTITISSTDLILSKDGYGTGRSEGVPFAALFLRPDDVLGKAVDRLLGDKPSSSQPAQADL